MSKYLLLIFSFLSLSFHFPPQEETCGNRIFGKEVLDIRTWNMQNTPGMFDLEYKFGKIPDKMTVYDGADTNGKVIFGTGEKIQGDSTLKNLKFKSKTGKITVKINGNTEKNTEWIYSVSCARKLRPPLIEFWVKDSTGNPIPYAEVLMKYNNGKERKAYADPTGLVIFDSLKANDVASIIASKREYKTKMQFENQKMIVIAKTSNEDRSIILYPAPIPYKIEPCGFPASSGKDVTDIRVWSMGAYSGTFDLHYHFYDIPDRMFIYEGRDTLYEKVFEIAKPISTRDYKHVYKIPFHSKSGYITVKVIGNTNKGTSWEYKIDCPK
jgi:hypothetical protein